MKKNLLTIALVAGALLPASAQWYQVGGTVKVKPNTLKYVSGEQKISGGTESNEGWVNVRGNFTVDEGADKEFRNEFTSPTEYGQLIIADASESTGKVVGEYKTPGVGVFAYVAIAMPYVGINADDIATKAGITSKEWQNNAGDGTFSSNRWRNPVFVWDNLNFSLDDLSASDEITQAGDYKPTAYYSINNKVDDLRFRDTDYEGTPANGVQVLEMPSFLINNGRAFTNYNRNKYGESYGTYLKDAFVNVDYSKWGTIGEEVRPDGFGDNYFYFGNPYTSNVDLTEVLKDENIVGVIQFNSTNFDETKNQGNGVLGAVSFSKKTTYDADSNSFTGDSDVLKLRPYHAFAVKTKGDVPDFKITLNDDVKMFTFEGAEAPSYNARSTRKSNGLKQVRVKLNDANEKELYRTYVVASKSFKAEAKGGNEAYATNLTDEGNAIYTFQETESGEISEDLKGAKTYINGINEKDYVGKPIYIAHQVVNPGKYSFSFDLSKGVSGSNKFYFEDKETGIVEEITSNFVYTFNALGSSTDRFRIYWNDKPVTEALATNDVVSQETVVYRDNTNTYKVRFANNLKSADVYVYNVLGQLVHSKNAVNTVVDYVLPLENSSAAYVVKVVGDNGVVTTKKIVK